MKKLIKKSMNSMDGKVMAYAYEGTNTVCGCGSGNAYCPIRTPINLICRK